jgi:hypothetical protein
VDADAPVKVEPQTKLYCCVYDCNFNNTPGECCTKEHVTLDIDGKCKGAAFAKEVVK